jgi:preprotein translocase subunit SecD
MRNGLVPLVGMIAVVAAALIGTIVAGYRPLLGIDLTGGVEVVLQAADDPNRSEPPSEAELDQAVQILRNRVDGLDVAQPDITRQGSRVVVQLPDVDDQQRAIDLVGTTAELQFRPVCAVIPILDQSITPATGDEPVETPAPTDEEGFGFSGDGEYAAPAIPSQTDSTDEQPPEEPAAVTPDSTEPAPSEILNDAAVPPSPCESNLLAASSDGPTPADEILRDEPVVLDQVDENGNPISRYLLGPVPDITIEGETVYLVGASIETAEAVNTGFEAVVSLTMKEGDGGIRLFNTAAGECFAQAPTCPTGQLAIVLDGVVESAPNINAAAFERDAIQISGGFTQERAADTALVLRYGSLPVELEQQQVRTVSASLGSDSLRAGIISGLIGLALVAVYMLAYYRLLGVAALLSLAVSGALLWVLISFFSETGFFFSGVTLTIAGVVGLIVSMGVSLDSNVVYFEHLKEDIANGRTLRSAVDRAFPVAYRTIFWADMAALIGAVILYTLTSASVREFALMLGLASVLDLIATYFFLRPLVRLMSRTQLAIDNPAIMGLPPVPERVRA